MDMNCRKCREPWDWFHIRDEVLREQKLYEEIEKSGGYVKDDNIGDPFRVHETNILSKTKKSILDMEALATWQFSPGPYILQCPACIGEQVELTDKQKERSSIESAIADVLGDDIDGMMAEMEDFDMLFGE